MKIKTITCHEVYNYGASLQEYALLKYLQNLGHEAETIHYKPPYLAKNYRLWVVPGVFFNKNFLLKITYLFLKLPKRLIKLKRKKRFDEFSIKHIKSTNKLYKSNDELKKDIPVADAYICGSDQIWNSFFDNGKDPAFYLDFVPNNKLKISYAASFAIEKLESEIEGFVREKVSRLDYVSVREVSGKKILRNLGLNNVVQVLDPVFLLDPQEWHSLMNTKIEKNAKNEKYILVYDFDNNPIIKKLAKRLKKDKGWEIYAFNEKINYANKNFYLEGPEVFLTLVKNAECILANSFHAVAYSLIFHKDLAVFNRNDKINTRMRDLLESVGLGHLLLLNEDATTKYMLNTIDYLKVQQRLDIHIENSKSFLNIALTN